ncbi:MAG: hypothetical protein K0S46_2035 [Moraxellaceae bacterium]|jgi:hypothetical protein|nr:hypothetical protein [Moraxellaceae bacterium]
MRITFPAGLALLLALLICISLQARADLADLSETELASVTGQQGVLLNLNLRNNVDAALAPIGCTAVVGVPNPCRLGLEFAARAGTWLMLKEFYGTLQLKDLRLDIGFMPVTATAYANPARFDANGSAACTSPLLPACSPAGRPALTFSYPGADSPGTYDDMLSFLNIGRVWLEFDTGGTPSTPGYSRDTSLNSAFGVRMSDSRALNAPAQIRFLGKGYVYGF